MKNFDCWYKDVCTKDDIFCSNCIRFIEMRALMDNSNIPKAKQFPEILRPPKCDLSAFRRLNEIKDNINDFVKSGKCLYITSDTTGNGKTTWSIKLMLKYFDTVWAGNGFKCRGIFIHTPTFLLKCKDFNNRDDDFEEIKRRLSTVDLVIWDDIASTDISAYDYSQLLMYIDTRVNNNKSNIFTGNITTQETMKKSIGAKLTSRIFASQTEIIKFEGADRR